MIAKVLRFARSRIRSFLRSRPCSDPFPLATCTAWADRLEVI